MKNCEKNMMKLGLKRPNQNHKENRPPLRALAASTTLTGKNGQIKRTNGIGKTMRRTRTSMVNKRLIMTSQNSLSSLRSNGVSLRRISVRILRSSRAKWKTLWKITNRRWNSKLNSLRTSRSSRAPTITRKSLIILVTLTSRSLLSSRTKWTTTPRRPNKWSFTYSLALSEWDLSGI